MIDKHTIIRDIRNAHKGDIDSAPSKTVTEYFEEIIEKAENFAGTFKQKLTCIFSQFLKIKPTEKNIDDMADILGQSEILEPDAKKRRNSARQKRTKEWISWRYTAIISKELVRQQYGGEGMIDYYIGLKGAQILISTMLDWCQWNGRRSVGKSFPCTFPLEDSSALALTYPLR